MNAQYYSYLSIDFLGRKRKRRKGERKEKGEGREVSIL